MRVLTLFSCYNVLKCHGVLNYDYNHSEDAGVLCVHADGIGTVN